MHAQMRPETRDLALVSDPRPRDREVFLLPLPICLTSHQTTREQSPDPVPDRHADDHRPETLVVCVWSVCALWTCTHEPHVVTSHTLGLASPRQQVTLFATGEDHCPLTSVINMRLMHRRQPRAHVACCAPLPTFVAPYTSRHMSRARRRRSRSTCSSPQRRRGFLPARLAPRRREWPRCVQACQLLRVPWRRPPSPPSPPTTMTTTMRLKHFLLK